MFTSQGVSGTVRGGRSAARLAAAAVRSGCESRNVLAVRTPVAVWREVLMNDSERVWETHLE